MENPSPGKKAVHRGEGLVAASESSVAWRRTKESDIPSRNPVGSGNGCCHYCRWIASVKIDEVKSDEVL